MSRTRRLSAVGIAVLLAALGTACSVADPDPSQVALHYSGGPFSSQTFQNCTAPGTREVDGPNEIYAYYPAGQRTYTFSDLPGADAPPINVSTDGNAVELVVRGTVTFTMDTSCKPMDIKGKHYPGGVLQFFHETIGRQTNAFAQDSGSDMPPEWGSKVLRIYIGQAVERAMDNAGLSFQWTALYGNAATKAQWEKQVAAQLQDLIDKQVGTRVFSVDNIQISKPDVPQQIRKSLDNQQAATIDTDAAKNFPGGVDAYVAYQQQAAINQAIRDGKANINVVPPGASIMVPGQR